MGRMSDPAESDEALLGRYARGDAAAFAALYRRHEMRIWRYLERNVGNRASAEELMQEVWFAVARDAGRYQPRPASRPGCSRSPATACSIRPCSAAGR